MAKVRQNRLWQVAAACCSRSLAEQASDSLGVARAHLHVCWMLHLRREWGLLATHLEPAIGYCRDHGQELFVDQLLSFQMQADLARGRWDEAARYASAVLARPEHSSAVSRCSALLVLARVRARRGEPDYWPLIDEALRLTKTPAVGFMAAPAAAARAEAAWLEGRTADVLAEEALPSGRALGLDPLAALELTCWRWRAGADIGPEDNPPEPYRMPLAGDSQGAQCRDRRAPGRLAAHRRPSRVGRPRKAECEIPRRSCRCGPAPWPGPDIAASAPLVPRSRSGSNAARSPHCS
jgi:hypothetical protein